MDRTVYIQNDRLRLIEYLKSDDQALYQNWLDKGTQDGYNFTFDKNFEAFSRRPKNFRLLAMIQRRSDDAIIGSITISPPLTDPELSIWIFEPFRRQGYGTNAFALATHYATHTLQIDTLYASAYTHNVGGLKMLERCGYVANTQGNIREKHYLTGEYIMQLGFAYSPSTPHTGESNVNG